jgi:hypothetical protein
MPVPSPELRARVSQRPTNGVDSLVPVALDTTTFDPRRDTGRAPPSNKNARIESPARIETVLSGKPEYRDKPYIMKGYTGHQPRAKEVVGTTLLGPTEGSAYRGPKCPPAPYVVPMPPNRFSEGC